MKRNFLLFPGMMLHELAHALACALLGVRVRGMKLWGTREASITHEATTGWRNFLVSIAPFFVNTLAAALAFFIADIGVQRMVSFTIQSVGVVALFYWLGLSFAYFAFPSDVDLRSGWAVLWKHYKDRMFFKRGLIAAAMHWLTFPFLIPAWFVLTVLGAAARPNAGFVWAAALFVAVAVAFL